MCISITIKPWVNREGGGVQPWEIWALWVHPNQMRKGVGKSLLGWAKHFAAASGQVELAIDADPNAEAFYRACGARVVGSVAAPITCNPMRVRPQLRLSTSGPSQSLSV